MSQIEARRELTRTEVADYLREFADELDADRPAPTSTDTGRTPDTTDSERAAANDPNAAPESERTTYEKVTILVGNDSATVNPPETVDFEVAVDSDSSLVESGERRRVSLVLEWDAREVDDGDGDIEIV